MNMASIAGYKLCGYSYWEQYCTQMLAKSDNNTKTTTTTTNNNNQLLFLLFLL